MSLITKQKTIKDLESLSKKIKKRIYTLESKQDTDYTESIVLLSQEYRQIKESILRILTN